MLRMIFRNGFLSDKKDFSDKHCFRVLFFSVVFLLFSARCCPAEKVDILLPGKEGDWEKAGSYLQEQFDAAGVTAEVIYSGDDAGKQKEDLLRLISEKPDLLLLAAADPADIGKAAEKAVRTGIPVIAFGRLLMSRRIPWCITFDSRQAGEAQGQFLADLLDLDHARDAVYRVEFLCGSRVSDEVPVREEKGGGRQETGLQDTDGQDMEGQPGDGRDEGGQICAGALEFLQPYMDEGLLTSLAADPERMQDLPELECFLSLPELKKRYAGESVLPDLILCADGQTALDTADWARERYQGRKPPLITAVGLDAELAGALRSGDVTMTAFCPWKYEAAAAVDLTLALLSGEMISQDWVEHAGFPFECCLGNRFGSGDLQNDTLLLRPETVTGNNLEKILYLYKEDEPQTDPGF